MSWSLVTAPDELVRCCYVDAAGQRCEQRTAFRIEPADPAQRAADDYAYVCGDHVLDVLKPGYVATLMSLSAGGPALP